MSQAIVKVTFWEWVRDRFVAGLFIVVPVALVFWIVKVLYSTINEPADSVVRGLIEDKLLPGSAYFIQHHHGTIPGAGFLITLLLVLVTGIFVRNYLGRRIVLYLDQLLTAVPIVKTIYTSLQQVVQAFQQFGDKSNPQKFSQVVLVPFSGSDSYSIGFLTGRFRDPAGQEYANVFVPTPPNPFNGLLVVAPIERLVKIDYLTVEQATKMIISLGLVTPKSITVATKNTL
jgi:uncharacterized membrane protein